MPGMELVNIQDDDVMVSQLRDPELAAQLASWEFTRNNFELLPFKVIDPAYLQTLENLNGYYPVSNYPPGCDAVRSEMGCSAIYRYIFAKVDITEIKSDDGIPRRIRARAKFGKQKEWGEAEIIEDDFYTALRSATLAALKQLN
jgi:hypothetical protein